MAKRKKLVKGLWSKNDVKLLKKLFANRKTQEVADELGRSLRSVMGKAQKMGLKKTKKHRLGFRNLHTPQFCSSAFYL